MRSSLMVLGSMVAFALSFGAQPAAHAKTATPVVEVTLDDHGMTPSVLNAAEDHPIHLHIVNRGQQPHQFSIPDFYIFTRTLGPGETSEVEFSPYKLGSFAMTSDPVAGSAPEYHGTFRVHS
ncbi:hypothetical protein GCM10025857_06020 [Alicyclobacillus contaminans]|uniref:cupredoxin domain-containing protein n=1 Tax=Alicyclobacillus contaminans TaxID=392016 RepID=UPI00042999A9|nr:cupredoxin domain-containing protein [Alicyclobacillus contaminans]GMA49245.1 hypothetical protein GCM10025857_06020 [Alicyclobacillus contaminans]